MFDRQAAMDVVDVLADGLTSSFECFKAAVELKSIAEAAEAEALAYLAVENSWSNDDDDFSVVGQRFVRVGADGTALIDESLPLEVAVAKGCSVTAASWLLRDVVNLFERHPFTWEAVQEGLLPLWRAQQVSQMCYSFGLDADETMLVERDVRRLYGVVGWRRVLAGLKAAVMQAAPEKVQLKSEQARRARFCHLYKADDPTLGVVSACLDASDALVFDETVGRLAGILGQQGDQSEMDVLRAKAMGLLGTPEQAVKVLAGVAVEATPVRAQVYVHMHAATLEAGAGVVRVERIGPVMVSQLTDLLGHAKIRLAPVINVGDGCEVPVDAYEVPDVVREQVILRDRFEVLPYSSREARNLDADHTIAFQPGIPGQTRPSNLGLLSRRAHRVKTHCGWQLLQPEPGWFLWTTRYGQVVVVGPDGTHPYHQRQ